MSRFLKFCIPAKTDLQLVGSLSCCFGSAAWLSFIAVAAVNGPVHKISAALPVGAGLTAVGGAVLAVGRAAEKHEAKLTNAEFFTIHSR